MPILHIFGASGAGTSSLGHALHRRLDYLQLDTDDYFWVPTNPPFLQTRPVEQRLCMLNADIAKSEKIVISGSLCGWGDPLIPKFDLLIRLITPTETRLSRLKKREFKRFGARILENGDMYEEHQRFLQWASEYDAGDSSMRSKAMHDEWQGKAACPQITLDGTLPPETLVSAIAKKFAV